MFFFLSDELEHALSQLYRRFVFSRLLLPGNPDCKECTGVTTDSDDGKEINHCIFGRQFTVRKEPGLESYKMIYIGSEGTVLTNFMMTHNKCQFCTYDPSTREARQESVNVNKQLMRRYYLIEKAKDAQIVGILVGTLGVSNYLDSIARLKQAIKNAGKKSYTFVVGKLSVEKLANFAEVDIYVLVACAENSLLDSSEFYRPVVTPFEMEMACNQNREWTGEFVVDFRELLSGDSLVLLYGRFCCICFSVSGDSTHFELTLTIYST